MVSGREEGTAGSKSVEPTSSNPNRHNDKKLVG